MSENADLKSQREEIEKAVHPPEAIPGALLTNWVFVGEFMSTEGQKWLCRFDSEDMTVWLRRGMLHDALEGSWEVDEPE